MIKINTKVLENEPDLKLEFYDTVSRIPLNIKLRDYKMSPSVIKIDNLEGGNFIEFRFDKDIGDLFEITVVSINNNIVKFADEFHINIINCDYNAFFMNDLNNKKDRNDLHTNITKTSNSICFTFGDDNKLSYFLVSGGLYIGIDSNHNLKSFYLKGLSMQSMKDILGD